MQEDERILRLERRIERERRAREAAEEIAERGMRDLWLANQELESRVAERTADLEQSLRAVRMAGDAKEAFLADLGHELATPLHAVLGLLELIDRGQLADDDRSRLDQASANARQLADLLFGLVELAGAEGAVSSDEFESVTPSTWLDQLVEAWARRAATSGQLLVPICHAPAAPVSAPWSRLRHVVDLLLDNAVVHADPGTLQIDLDIDDVAVVCHIRDAGPGLDEHQLATAAEPFVRFGDRGRLGIGLALATRLIRAADGSLELDNDGDGTRATVSLPLSRPATPAPAPAPGVQT
jgi:two-component system sensor histidine kinase EvgS